MVFYLATPPTVFPLVDTQLGEAGLSRSRTATRSVVLGKPFGRDGASARELDAVVRSAFRERQVFRIDHYLGKETVQNILVLRFANGIFEPVWNRNFIDHVQITVAESLGVEGRGHFYEEAGAMRDIVQNHLLQVLSFVAMEPPGSFDVESVRNERARCWPRCAPWARPTSCAASTTRAPAAARRCPPTATSRASSPTR